MSGLRRQVGARGEELAKDYLVAKGYRWRESNFRTKGGEVDLVMEDKDCLVFVEVKSRRSDQYGEPEEAITANKMRHMAKTALLYVKLKGVLGKTVRFDVVTIASDGLRHHPDAFQVPAGNYYY